MGKIMELFYGELGAFQAKMEDAKWEVEFRDEKTDTRTCMACGHKDNGTIR